MAQSVQALLDSKLLDSALRVMTLLALGQLDSAQKD
jgi:hypothetical protein